MNQLETSACIPTLEMYVAEITDRQIEREGAKIGKKANTDRELGPLTSDLAKRLWCAGKIIKAKEAEADSRANMATEDHEEQSLKREAKQLNALADVCGEMMWYEIRDSLNFWDGSIGIRNGWIVVNSANSNEPPEFIKRILGME